MTRTPSPQTTEGLGATPLTAEEERELRSEVARQLPKMAAFASIGGGREWPVFARLLATVDAAREQCRRAHPGDGAEPVSSDAARPSVPSEALAEADLAEAKALAAFDEPVLIEQRLLRAILAALPNREDAPDWTAAQHREDAKLVQAAMQKLAERRITSGLPYVPIEDASDLLMALHRDGIYRPVREDAPSREGLDAAYTAIRAAIVQPDASLDTAYVPWRAIKAAFRAALAATPPGDREDRRPMISDTIFQLTSFTRHRPWCPEFSGPGDCTCGLYALLDSIRCTCGHKVSVHTNRDVSDVVGWPCIECKSARCHGFDLSSEEAAVTTAEAAAGEEWS